MGKFRIIAGTYSIGNRGNMNMWKKGQVVESDENLAEKYPEKFAELRDDTRADKPAEVKAAPKLRELEKLSEEGPEAKTPKPKKAKKEEPESLGKDVTKKYELAKDKGLLVFVNSDDEYFITRKSDPTTPLNESPLRKKEVKPNLVELE